MLKRRLIVLTFVAALATLYCSFGASAQDSPRGYLQKVLDQPGVAESFTPGCLGKKYPAYDDRAGWAKLLGKEKAEEMIANINANNKTIRYELGTRVRNQLRIIPELRFFVDDSLDYIEHIDELLKK